VVGHIRRIPGRALLVILVVVATLGSSPRVASAALAPVALRSASTFAALAATTVTSEGASRVAGDIGVSPGIAVTGFPPGTLTGSIHSNDAVSTQAQADLATAYADAVARTADSDLSGQGLGGLTLDPGVYKFGVTAQLSGDVTLDGGGDPDAVFIFQIGSTFTTAANSRVTLINGAQACRVVWQVGSSATIGAETTFAGSVLAFTAITVVAGTAVDGSMLAQGGAVTLDTNVFSRSACAPGTVSITSPDASDFPPTSITGVAQTTPADLGPFSVSDLTGTGAGWHVTAQATAFAGAAHDLVPSSVSMSEPSVAANGTVSDLPTVVAGPYTIDNGPVQIASAAPNRGMGTYDFGATTLTLNLPAHVYADTYNSTVTISVTTAP
jgi:hypothetical protein